MDFKALEIADMSGNVNIITYTLIIKYLQNMIGRKPMIMIGSRSLGLRFRDIHFIKMHHPYLFALLQTVIVSWWF